MQELRRRAKIQGISLGSLIFIAKISISEQESLQTVYIEINSSQGSEVDIPSLLYPLYNIDSLSTGEMDRTKLE